MSKYYVACESTEQDCFGMFNPLVGFSLSYFEIVIDPPINAERLREMINKDRKHKVGHVVSWSKIEE